MLKNYLKTAFRNLKRRPGYTAINVAGLAVGLAACLLIGLWVQHQLSYDDFHEGAERIHRIVLDLKVRGTEMKGALAPAPMAHTLVQELPEVEAATRFDSPMTVTVQVGEESFVEERLFPADTSFFELFSFPLKQGDPETALDDEDAVVLTEALAEKYFGDADPMGRPLTLNDQARRVTGVAENPPANSHFQFDLVAADRLSEQQETLWAANNFYTYFRLAEGASVEAFEEKLSGIVERRALPQISEMAGVPAEQLLSGEGARYRYFAQPMTDIHLHSHTDYEIQPNGSMAQVWTFSFVALFILGIACVNFMNLATARAAERSTEVGMRKVLGARRGQVAGQFFGESVLMTAGAFVLALALARLALPVFNDAAGTNLALGSLYSGDVLLALAGGVVLVGLLAGSYPAAVLSGFSPTAVLKSADRRRTGGGGRLRRGLVVAQFAISIGLIVGTLVVRDQFNYIQQKQLGLDKERVVVLDRAAALGERQNAFLEQVRQQQNVVQAGVGDELFGGVISNANYFPAGGPPSDSYAFNYLEVGFDFVETMGIEVARGRSFTPGRAADSTAVMLNEAAAEKLGWEHPVGKTLQTSLNSTEGETLEVIGVARDFNYKSLRREIEPLILLPDDGPQNRAYVRLAPGHPNEALGQVQQVWERFAPDQPFHYSFLDQNYDAVHRSTQRAGLLFSGFSALAILIACLGLFGLAAYTAERRTQEIGIRKTFGASTASIVALLSKDFARLVGVAFIVAAPVAWYGMRQWLEDFAYRVDLNPWLFAGAGALVMAVALLTVSYHALRAARTNPAQALRDE